jgi:hypothetical protein
MQSICLMAFLLSQSGATFQRTHDFASLLHSSLHFTHHHISPNALTHLSPNAPSHFSQCINTPLSQRTILPFHLTHHDTSLPSHLSPVTPLSHHTSLPSHLSPITPLPSHLSQLPPSPHPSPIKPFQSHLSQPLTADTGSNSTEDNRQQPSMAARHLDFGLTASHEPPTLPNPNPLPDLPSELEESPTPSEASVVLQSITTDTAPEIPAAAAAPAAATVTAAVTAAAVGVGKAAGVRDCCACIQFVTSTVAITTVVVAVGLVQWLWWGSSRCLCLCGVCVRACVCCGCI